MAFLGSPFLEKDYPGYGSEKECTTCTRRTVKFACEGSNRTNSLPAGLTVDEIGAWASTAVAPQKDASRNGGRLWHQGSLAHGPKH